MLRVRLFGTGQAKYYQRHLDGFPHQRASLLLCYLLLNHDYPHHRERLSATFWEEHPASVARKNLRNALWKLRQILQSVGAPPDNYLLTSDDSISFINSSLYWLDVDDFKETAARYEHLPGEELNAEQAAQLQDAANLYTGNLLESVYEDWCIYDREQLHLTHLSILNKLLVYYGISGDYERSLGYGKQILNLDNTMERVHRQVMCLEWLSGDRSGALAQYKLCAQILRDELDISPMEETHKLYKQMLHDQVRSSDWLLNQYCYSPIPMIQENDLTPGLALNLLKKLHQLQLSVEETSAEIRQIERMINRLFPNLDNP